MTTPCEHPWVGANKEENPQKKGKSTKKAKKPAKIPGDGRQNSSYGQKKPPFCSSQGTLPCATVSYVFVPRAPGFFVYRSILPNNGDAAPVVGERTWQDFLVRYFLQTAFSVFSFSLFSFFCSYFLFIGNLGKPNDVGS